MTNLLCYKHSTEKWKYILYISVTHKVLKSFRSKMVICAHDVWKVHGASSSYIKTCWQTFFICICILHLYESLSPAKNLLIPHPPTPGKISPTKFVFSHHQKSILPSLLIKSYNSGKTSFLAVVIAPVPFYFNFILFWHTGHANFDFNSCSVFTECCF